MQIKITLGFYLIYQNDQMKKCIYICVCVYLKKRKKDSRHFIKLELKLDMWLDWL